MPLASTSGLGMAIGTTRGVDLPFDEVVPLGCNDPRDVAVPHLSHNSASSSLE